MGCKLSKSTIMKYIKNKFVAIFLVLILILSALVFSIFGNDYTITVMVIAVWACMFLFRTVFPKYFSRKYTLYVINFIALYVLYIVATNLYDQYMVYKVYQFDINHDLIFSPEEQTAEQQMYWLYVIGDGGRIVFRPIMALLVSLGSSILLFLIVKFFELKTWKQGQS